MITTPITAAHLRGALDLEQTEVGVLPHRLPAFARAQCADPQVHQSESQPSGVRLVLRTAATTIELDALRTKMAYPGVPARPDGLYDLIVDGELAAQGSIDGGRTWWVDLATGARTMEEGPIGTIGFSGLAAHDKRVELWLPYSEVTELVALRTDAPVQPVARGSERVWLHHGSSISHGSNAASPTTTWPAIAARAAGVELINLGLGGAMMLDQFTARAIRDTPADLISVKIGINLVNADLIRQRAFTSAVHGFLDTIRDGHPTTPLLVISPIFCAAHEDTPGPSAPVHVDGGVRFVAAGDPTATMAASQLTLRWIRAELEGIVEQRATTDPQLRYLDGLRLYAEADGDRLPLPDGLHPDAATHRVMGDRFAAAGFLGSAER